MPDHLHFMWMGLRESSNQLNGMKFLRAQLEPSLGNNRRWQHQSYDHVLRDDERKRDVFARTCFYILANPVRANLVHHEFDWAFSGAIVPGYPTLHPLQPDFWEIFWKLYARALECSSGLVPASS